MFATHPLTQERITYLRETARPKAGAGEDRAAYRAIIRPHLRRWLEMEMGARDSGSTLNLLERLAAPGTDLGVIEYVRGEVYRVRNSDGDVALALASYKAAALQPDAPVEAWRQIGVLSRRQGESEAAIAAFSQYLELAGSAGPPADRKPDQRAQGGWDMKRFAMMAAVAAVTACAPMMTAVPPGAFKQLARVSR